MNRVYYWLRWIALFPSAVIAALLVSFPLHWVLYFTLTNGQLISGLDIKPIEYLFYPFIIAITFIFTGYKIAPKYKFKTAIVLFGIYILTWLTVSIISLSKSNMYGMDLQFSERTIIALVGAIIGLYITKKINNKELY